MSKIFEKVLITGGMGFIGKYLLEELISEDCSPTVITKNKEAHQLPENWQKKLRLVEIDIADHLAVRNFVSDFRPTLVINLAGVLGRQDTTGKICRRVNFTAAKNLLEAAHEAKAQRIILFGTADEYGNQPTPQRETFQLKPESPYSISKARMTKFAGKKYKNERVPVVVLRPFTVYGAGQRSEMFLSAALNCAMRNVPFEMTKGTQKRDYVYVSDHIKAIRSAIVTPGIEGEVINIGCGEAHALSSIAEKIWEVVGADKSLLKIGARPAGKSELYNTCADIAKASRLLDWRPGISLEEGIKKTVERLRVNERQAGKGA